MPSLRSLQLHGSLGSRHLQILADVGGFPALAKLRLSGASPHWFEPLGRLGRGGPLRELWIDNSSGGPVPADFAAWAASPATAGLRRLGIGLVLSPDQLRHLVTSPSLQQLIVLELPRVPISSDAARLLADEHLPVLGRLRLGPVRAETTAYALLRGRRGAALADREARGWWAYEPDHFDGDFRTPWEELA